MTPDEVAESGRAAAMPSEITAERLTSLLRPRSVALVGAARSSTPSSLTSA